MPYQTSSGFITAARDPQIRPEVRVTINDGLALDSFILDQSRLDDPTTPFSRTPLITSALMNVSSFSLSAFEGDPLQADNLSIDVQNLNKEFDYVILNRAVIGVPIKVEVGLDVSGTTEFVNRFSGYIDAVETYASDRNVMRLTAVNKAKRALERVIGNQASPVSYAAMNPADMVWDILTVRAGLDATQSLSNNDVDWQSFLDFKGTCASRNFSLAARFEGTSIAEALRLIGEATHGIVMARTDGKFVMSIYVPKFTGDETISVCDGNCDNPSMITDKSRLINRQQVRYGYNPATQTFAGLVEVENTASQTAYGLIGRLMEGTTVWHDTLQSARNFANVRVGSLHEPAQLVSMRARLGTGAIRLLPGDVVKVTWDQVPVDKEFRIYSVGGNITTSEYDLVMTDLDREKQYFILDLSAIDQGLLF